MTIRAKNNIGKCLFFKKTKQNCNAFYKNRYYLILPNIKGGAMENGSNIIAIYSRKSKFTGKGESVGNQVELCREYIRAHYGENAVNGTVVFEDEGFSGGNLQRPAFQKMMQQIERKKIKMLMVYRLDRVSRNVSDFSGLIETLSQKNITFVSVREQFDTATPMGRAMMYIASVFAQLERETIAERIRDNMHELAKTGRWLGGNTPTGYCSESVKSVTVDGKTKKACKLKLIPKEAEIVQTIFKLFSQTGSLTAVEAELIKQNILTKNGNCFTRFSIKSILQNPVYMVADEEAYAYLTAKEADLFSAPNDFDGVHGILAYNRTDQEKGRAAVVNPVKDWIVSVGRHKGLVPGKTWVGVQDCLERNKTKAYRQPRKNEALLTGFLYCSCGSRMYPKLSNRKTPEGKVAFSYVCKMKERSKKTVCSCKNVGGNTLDLAVTEQIKNLADDNGEFIKLLEKNKAAYFENRLDREQQLNKLQKEKTDLEKKVTALVATLADAVQPATKQALLTHIDQLNSNIEKVQQRIEKQLNLTAEHAFSNMEFDVLKQLLGTFKNGIVSMSGEQKRAAVRSLVRRIVWDGQNAHVILFGAEGELDFSKNIDFLKQIKGNDLEATKTLLGEDSK